MKNKKLMPVLAGMVFLILIAILCIIVAIIEKYTPSREKADLYEYFSVEEAGQEAGLVLGDQLLEEKAYVFDGAVYLEYQDVYTLLNDRVYWDNNENLLLYALPTELVKAEVGSEDYYQGKQKNSMDHVIVKTEGNTTYISLDFVQLFTDMEYEYYEAPSRVVLETGERTVQLATAKKPGSESKAEKYCVVREKADIKSPILKSLEKEESLQLIKKGKKWSKVRTKDGYIGYILNKYITDGGEETLSRNFQEPEYTNIQKDYTINMAWHQVTNASANNNLLTTVANAKGLTTISPTWFALMDNEGTVSSLASQTYVNYAHQLGLEVWGLVADFNNERISVDVNTLLSYTSKREKIINQLIAAAIENNLDGINVDFELISKDGAIHFLEFLRELSIKCRNNGLVLSVDNYVPTDSSLYYNRGEEGAVADYLIIMGYDEHYSGSVEAGSVASIGFVRDGVEKTLEEVPAEKVILAVPFYTRLWSETPKTEEEIAASSDTEEFVSYNLDSQVYSMAKTETFLSSRSTEVVWDEESGQNYLEYEENGVTYKMWIEDEKSIEEKLKVMKEQKLAGVSAWKLGLEKSSIWDTILKYVN
jgi:spore germination protein YaaH